MCVVGAPGAMGRRVLGAMVYDKGREGLAIHVELATVAGRGGGKALGDASVGGSSLGTVDDGLDLTLSNVTESLTEDVFTGSVPDATAGA